MLCWWYQFASLTGQYMTVVLSSDAGTGLGGATLRSVQEQVVGVQCLSFHYYLVSGDSTSPITFTVSSIHDSANKAALWSSTISHGNKWIALETTVDAPAQNQSPVSLEVSTYIWFFSFLSVQRNVFSGRIWSHLWRWECFWHRSAGRYHNA